MVTLVDKFAMMLMILMTMVLKMMMMMRMMMMMMIFTQRVTVTLADMLIAERVNTQPRP